ncbi:MAG: hypothetical protein R3A44_35330 [Caldilineaceae bacterium]
MNEIVLSHNSITLSKANSLRRFERECQELSKQTRPKYKITVIAHSGTTWGNLRMFKYLQELPDRENGYIFIDGATYGEMDILAIVEKISPLAAAFLKLPIFRSSVRKLIYDTEELGLETLDGVNSLEHLGKGLSGPEAFAIYDPTVTLFGLEDPEMFQIALDMAKDENEPRHSLDDPYFAIARLRSEVMFNNLIRAMDTIEIREALVFFTAFHERTFAEQATLRKINYKSTFIFDLPKEGA